MAESRNKLMLVSPIMQNWVSYLFSVYMQKDYERADKTIYTQRVKLLQVLS
jgi:hypothetical protein